MKQQMLEQELAALRDQLKEVGQERDDWKLLAELYKSEPAVDSWMPDLSPSMTDLMTDPENIPDYIEPTRKSDYNGWKNRETWQVYLWLDNDLADLDADIIEEIVKDVLNADAASGTLLGDIIYDFLSSVDFEELAKFYKSDDEEDDEDE